MVSSSLKNREVSPNIGPRSPLITMVSRQTQGANRVEWGTVRVQSPF